MCMTDCGNEEGKLLVVGIGSSIKNVISTLNNEHGKYHLLYMGEDGANSDGIDFYDMTFLLDDLNSLVDIKPTYANLLILVILNATLRRS